MKKTVFESQIPDWLPNWRKAQQYPELATTSPIQWAWEFLRRNPEYQRLWSELIEPWADQYGDCNFDTAIKEIGCEALSKFEKIFGIDLALPPLPPFHADAKFLFFAEGPCVITHNHPELYRKTTECEGTVYEAVMQINSKDILVKFDLAGEPIERQIERAKKHLKEQVAYLKKSGCLAVRAKRPRYDQFAKYLRVLDARLSGATMREIESFIYKKRKNDAQNYILDGTIRDDIKAAEILRDKDFRYLVLSAKK